MKELARENNQLTYLQQVLFFEKKIEGLAHYPQHAGQGRSTGQEADEVNDQLVCCQ